MKPILPLLFILLGCLLQSLGADDKTPSSESAGTSVILKLKAGASFSDVTALFDKEEIISHKKLSTSMEIYRLVISIPSQNLADSHKRFQEALHRIEKSGFVEYVESDTVIQLDEPSASATPKDQAPQQSQPKR